MYLIISRFRQNMKFKKTRRQENAEKKKEKKSSEVWNKQQKEGMYQTTSNMPVCKILDLDMGKKEQGLIINRENYHQ